MWKVIDKLGVLFLNFFTALKYAAYDYDAKLQITKTPKQRMMIWVEVGVVTIVGVLAILMMIGSVVKPFLNRP